MNVPDAESHTSFTPGLSVSGSACSFPAATTAPRPVLPSAHSESVSRIVTSLTLSRLTLYTYSTTSSPACQRMYPANSEGVLNTASRAPSSHSSSATSPAQPAGLPASTEMICRVHSRASVKSPGWTKTPSKPTPAQRLGISSTTRRWLHLVLNTSSVIGLPSFASSSSRNVLSFTRFPLIATITSHHPTSSPGTLVMPAGSSELSIALQSISDKMRTDRAGPPSCTPSTRNPVTPSCKFHGNGVDDATPMIITDIILVDNLVIFNRILN